jgi:hypothetical protein
VCVGYPPEQFPRKVAFGGGAFYVEEIKDKATDYACLAGDPNWIAERAEAIIDNRSAVRFLVRDNWTSHHLERVYYRVFAKNRCFHLAVQWLYVSTGPFDPGTYEEFTRGDDEMVQHRLQETLRSFHFNK